RPILLLDGAEDSVKDFCSGVVPQLNALRLHNGTVWRWNRPCYGITDGKPHLRIENRVLPAGPTIVDEVSNAAFFTGAVYGMHHLRPAVRNDLAFNSVMRNFVTAARLGFEAQFNWFGGKRYSVGDLMVQELLPLASDALLGIGID